MRIVAAFFQKSRATDQIAADLAEKLKVVAKRMQRDDGTKITNTIAQAVIAQEATRMHVVGGKMNRGLKSEMDKDQLVAYWRALAHHYRGTRQQEALKLGAEQLEKLSSADAISLVYAIRGEIKPVLNKEMETKQLKVGIKIPVIGQFGLGALRWTARGPRVSIRKLRWLLVRLFAEIVVWASAGLGTIHWIAWTIFNEPFVAHASEDATKLVQLVLLIATTGVAWIVPRVIAEHKWIAKWLFRVIGWGIVVGGWLHWGHWVLLDGNPVWGAFEPVQKIALILCVLSTYLAGWSLRHMFPRGNTSN